MSSTGPPPFPVDAVATAVVCLVILAVLLKWIARHLPFRVPLGFVLAVVGGLLVVCGIDALVQRAPAALAAGLLGTGLVVFVVWRRQRTEPARESHRQRVEQARGRARRRAPPPLPPASPPGGAP